ncbi:hypothetical protein [Flammeovirga sp. SJP92]|uniref:hypothetical protein n=1 Tax=Flammeovirga sp. SJP92 TaxID=1775430 RepID=UPI000789A747|nr:hypothetical protein [Flammeovirga sp. SJP92]KXX72467.1 hypothetical protein AVL50_02370 [Flammeovirga sp. SJP92]
MSDEDSADEFVLDPVQHVFHDAIEVEVEDSLTQLAIDVKIVGWQKSERGFYSLHYKFSKREKSTNIINSESIPYNQIQIRDDVLTENLFFDELDSLTEYCLELQSSYRDEVTRTDTYFFSTKGDTTTNEME